ncbi:MAG: hypothetical protein Q8P32_04150 [Candidatus Komeilibacteria bacterium]|nr:hypothetical protein [Candidatus Komeilibacteria bacterium]
MDYLGKLLLRKVYYLSIKDFNDLFIKDLPDKNWLVFVFSDERSPSLLNELAEVCLTRSVLYVCTSGKSNQLIHDIFDKVIIENKNNPKVDKDILTTWNENFEEEFWFAIVAAYHPYKDINSVVCIDLGLNKKEKIKTLINKINSGWLPEKNKHVKKD